MKAFKPLANTVMEGESRTAAVKLVESFEKLARESLPTSETIPRNDEVTSLPLDVEARPPTGALGSQSSTRSQPMSGSILTPTHKNTVREEDKNSRVKEGPELDDDDESENSSTVLCGFSQNGWCRSKPCMR